MKTQLYIGIYFSGIKSIRFVERALVIASVKSTVSRHLNLYQFFNIKVSSVLQSAAKGKEKFIE